MLVTGGTGFLGGWCVVQALERGHDVRATVRDVGREAAVRDAVAETAGRDEVLDQPRELAAPIAALSRDEGFRARWA